MAKRCGHRRTEAQPGFCPVLFSRTPFLKKLERTLVPRNEKGKGRGKGGQSANAKLRLLTVRSGG